MYNKSPLTIQQQIAQLKSRGLRIEDEDKAEHVLQSISYYRLAGYWWPMQADKALHTFKSGSTFEDVIAIYNFDRELRLMVFGVIERIEIGFRTKLIYYLSHEKSPWWFEDSTNFKDQLQHGKVVQTIDRELSQSKDIFIIEHYKNYILDTRRPPAWKTLEITSLGTISKLYGNLLPGIKAKNTIAAELGTVNHTYLPSWLLSITQIRNLCAHHSRLWNRNLPGRPKLMPSPPNKWINQVPPVSEYHMLYVHLCCMKYLLNIVQPGNQFGQRLKNLLDKYPTIDPNALGMTPHWESEPLWE
ncbi:Abi family protein [Telluribacter sp.]|jgi:abortive infection bacteriophage resistance protein|uniref:Abi family protein n=1 Tax=Telluribacter sp. TaxID=1978767 RepID=UPI002E0F3B66|nr:Abi family protein [Telluribacter sp.]